MTIPEACGYDCAACVNSLGVLGYFYPARRSNRGEQATMDQHGPVGDWHCVRRGIDSRMNERNIGAVSATNR